MVEKIYRLSVPMLRTKPVERALSVWNKALLALLRKCYPAYCRKHPVTRGVTDEKYDKEIVVSLTTFPARYETIGMTLESLLRQTMKPNRILVWLTKAENPNQVIPEAFLPFVDKGVEVCFSDSNLMPHNKSYHTAKLDADRYIITVDDDIVYPEGLIQRLYTTYKANDPKTVVCELAHWITLDEDGVPRPYDQRDMEAKGMAGPSHRLMAKGVGGVLYPPGFFRDGYFDEETIRATCLMADDLWLKFQEVVRGYPVVKTKRYAKQVFTLEQRSQKVSLNSINNGEKRNNVQLKNLLDTFPDIPWASF